MPRVLRVEGVLAECGQHAAPPLEVDEVRREFSTGRGPVDILLKGRVGGKTLVLAVENKIDSSEAEGQVCRYGQGLAGQFGVGNVVIAFLTPDGSEPNAPPECPLACISYRTVADLLDGAIQSAPEQSGGGIGLSIARHYLDTVRTQIMTQPNSEIDAICQELYDEHRDAWRAIRRRLPSKRDEWHSDIGSAACKRFAEAYGGDWQFSVRRERYACVFRPAWNELGTSESDLIIGVTPSAGPGRQIARVHLRLVVDTVDTDSGEHFNYKLRLKVDTRHATAAVAKSVISALEVVTSIRAGLPDRDQFTVPLKSTEKLPGLGGTVGNVPDSVIDWFARHVADVVKALDSVFPKA